MSVGHDCGFSRFEFGLSSMAAGDRGKYEVASQIVLGSLLLYLEPTFDCCDRTTMSTQLGMLAAPKAYVSGQRRGPGGRQTDLRGNDNGSCAACRPGQNTAHEYSVPNEFNFFTGSFI